MSLLPQTGAPPALPIHRLPHTLTNSLTARSWTLRRLVEFQSVLSRVRRTTTKLARRTAGMRSFRGGQRFRWVNSGWLHRRRSRSFRLCACRLGRNAARRPDYSHTRRGCRASRTEWFVLDRLAVDVTHARLAPSASTIGRSELGVDAVHTHRRRSDNVGAIVLAAITYENWPRRLSGALRGSRCFVLAVFAVMYGSSAITCGGRDDR